jgi:hypothetical protein
VPWRQADMIKYTCFFQFKREKYHPFRQHATFMAFVNSFTVFKICVFILFCILLTLIFFKKISFSNKCGKNKV